jgi:hypothetical protein
MPTWRVIVGGIPEKAMADGIAMVLRGDDSPDFLTFVVEDEQEARTLARAEVIAALTSEDQIAHGEASDGVRLLGECAYDDEPWPCRTQRGIDSLLSRLGERE